ncbi:hypothetical protein [uncultured Tateyamaria sp.]|uniref:hypothetical protein n=1 Tax=uncultured Tateyamaria sp. TaxID=455651 RepID=UPI002627C8F4|nr:hypothetical protein [uncultured Tateyamaria sp.]
MTDLQFDLFPDYFQFHAFDAQSNGVDGAAWSETAVYARVALNAHGFAVSTARNMDVPVRLVVSDTPPTLDLALWDHVVEFSIEVPSGQLIVAGCTDDLADAEQISLERGCYAVRVLQANLATLSEDGLDGEDHYRVELWKGHNTLLKVLKQYSEPGGSDASAPYGSQ